MLALGPLPWLPAELLASPWPAVFHQDLLLAAAPEEFTAGAVRMGKEIEGPPSPLLLSGQEAPLTGFTGDRRGSRQGAARPGRHISSAALAEVTAGPWGFSPPFSCIQEPEKQEVLW